MNWAVKLGISLGMTQEYAEELHRESITHPHPRVWCEECINEDPRIRRIVLENDIKL